MQIIKMEKKKIKKRKITFEVPEPVYHLMKKAVVTKNTTIDVAKDSLIKISDVARESLVKGLVTLKEVENEANKRLREKAKSETKQLSEK